MRKQRAVIILEKINTNPMDADHRWMTGRVIGHPKFQDGDRVNTSKILKDETRKNGKRYVTTSRTIYQVKRPSDVWAEELGIPLAQLASDADMMRIS